MAQAATADGGYASRETLAQAKASLGLRDMALYDRQQPHIGASRAGIPNPFTQQKNGRRDPSG